jgi:GntR family transcriptional regulator
VPRRPKKAQEIAAWLEGRLDAGEFAQSEWLPAWETLAREYADAHPEEEKPPARGTIRAALQVLVDQGRVEVLPGRGAKPRAPRPVTRTAADQLRVAGEWRGWHVVCAEQGRRPYTDPERGWTTLGPEAGGWLGLPVGTRVFSRWRTQGWHVGKLKQPVVLSWTFINPALTTEIPKLLDKSTGRGGMTTLFEEAGYQVWWEEHVDSRSSTPEEAERLEIAEGAPVLDVWRRCYDQNERILEVTRRVINPRLHRLIYRYP